MYLVLGEKSSEKMCDCALGHSLGRMMIHNLPRLQNKMDEDSIIILSHIAVFLTKPHIFNVLQSGHETWMFGSEPVFYNLGMSWPTVFTAMTVRRWRHVTNNSRSCAEVVHNHQDIFNQFYNPPWREAIKRNETDLSKISNTNINIMEGVVAGEKFVTNR